MQWYLDDGLVDCIWNGEIATRCRQPWPCCNLVADCAGLFTRYPMLRADQMPADMIWPYRMPAFLTHDNLPFGDMVEQIAGADHVGGWERVGRFPGDILTLLYTFQTLPPYMIPWIDDYPFFGRVHFHNRRCPLLRLDA